MWFYVISQKSPRQYEIIIYILHCHFYKSSNESCFASEDKAMKEFLDTLSN